MTERDVDSGAAAMPEQPPRRYGLIASVAAVAAVAGMGLGWWNFRRVESGVSGTPEGFWQQQWESPQGGVVRMEAFRGRPVLINFWATWCPPCVEELPLINAFFHQNKVNGWQVLALAVDKTSAVQTFLRQHPLDFTVAVAGIAGADLSRAMGNLAGGLPFSLVIGADGQVLQRKIGRLTEADLQAWSGLK